MVVAVLLAGFLREMSQDVLDTQLPKDLKRFVSSWGTLGRSTMCSRPEHARLPTPLRTYIVGGRSRVGPSAATLDRQVRQCQVKEHGGDPRDE